ncbi:MAG: cytochrome P450, partial [Sphingomonadales bacterium]|nr:cytochrome P450 [Sphingomonadales bacterium]
GHDALNDLLNRKADAFSSCLSVLGPLPPLPFTPEGSDITAQLDAVRDELPWSAHLVCYDGARHAEHRAIMTGLLTWKRLKQNEDYLYGLVDRLIDRFVGNGGCNVVPEFSHAITTYAISDFMGIPEADRAVLLEAIGAPPSQLEGDAPLKIGPDPLIAMKPLFDGYLRNRLENPTGDLMSELVRTRYRDGSEVPFEILSNLARFTFGAGQDTTSHLISMAVRLLAEDPALQQRLRADPGRVPDFIEEVLRFDPPVKVAYRLALKDTEVAGVAVPAGSVMTACLVGANRDPAHFDDPDRLDIDRPHARDHMAFSRGLHACPGAPLGRMEARIALEKLLARTGEFHLSEAHHGGDGDRRYNFVPTYTFRSLADLHIEFTPA